MVTQNHYNILYKKINLHTQSILIITNLIKDFFYIEVPFIFFILQFIFTKIRWLKIKKIKFDTDRPSL